MDRYVGVPFQQINYKNVLLRYFFLFWNIYFLVFNYTWYMVTNNIILEEDSILLGRQRPQFMGSHSKNSEALGKKNIKKYSEHTGFR